MKYFALELPGNITIVWTGNIPEKLSKLPGSYEIESTLEVRSRPVYRKRDEDYYIFITCK